MVNHRVDTSHGEFPGEDRGIRGNSPDPTGTESHSERARQLHWKKIYADHPMLTVGVTVVIEQRGYDLLGFIPGQIRIELCLPPEMDGPGYRRVQSAARGPPFRAATRPVSVSDQGARCESL